MFELILSRLAAIGQNDGAGILPADEISAWPQNDIAAYNRLRLLKKAAPAKTVECPGCEDACLMPVHVFPTQDSKPARIFVACDKREDTGRVLIEPATLEQWQIDIHRFVSLLASALGTDHSPDEIIPKQVFYLGSLTINRKRRSAFFAANEEILSSALAADLFRRYGQPFFLVAGELNGPQELEHDQTIISLRNLLSLFDYKSLSLDRPVLEQLISVEDSRRAVAAITTGEKGVEENIFRREGQNWTVRFDGVTNQLNHSKGLLYISYLLGIPFQEYHATELVKTAEDPKKEVMSFSAGEVATKETIANYRKRILAISADLAEIERNKEDGVSSGVEDCLFEEELLRERFEIEKQIRQAVGIGGKLKKNSDEGKKNAKSVSTAIYRSYDILKEKHPSLWRHLFNAIKIGEYLSYTPELDISWITIK